MLSCGDASVIAIFSHFQQTCLSQVTLIHLLIFLNVYKNHAQEIIPFSPQELKSALFAIGFRKRKKKRVIYHEF